MTKQLAISLCLLAVTAVQTCVGDDMQEARQLDVHVRVQLDYLLYLPKDYDETKPWPLMLFLHGAGERGTDLELVKKHGPPKLIAAGKEFPCIVVSPQCPKERWWHEHELIALLDEIVARHSVDEDRIYVTGLSMGGFGTWALARFAPQKFAAMAPICGGGDRQSAKHFPHIPIWAFHGAKDKVVPFERSEEMIAALKKEGGNPKFTTYPEAGHDSWTETYENEELYEWLFSHKRQPVEKADERSAK